jgi:hypothetical protein
MNRLKNPDINLKKDDMRSEVLTVVKTLMLLLWLVTLWTYR